MSGHSKWASIKRQKAVTDAKKGAVFTKLANNITLAAREKGGDPNMNFSLRLAIDRAKAANMPKENIERAIRRGTGADGGAAIVELVYEAIGPGNSQFVVKSLTDNKNRSASSIRHTFTKHGGSFGAVLWNFEIKGVLRISGSQLPTSGFIADEFDLELIDNGADDVQHEDEGMTIYAEPGNLQKVKEFIESKNIAVETAEIEYVPKESIDVSEDDREKIDKIVDELEGNEDVGDYYMNCNI